MARQIGFAQDIPEDCYLLAANISELTLIESPWTGRFWPDDVFRSRWLRSEHFLGAVLFLGSA